MRLLRFFIRRSDRIRGTGWLDCPNCQEHATQDVVDELTFFCISFYRLTPILRRRRLVCRRCSYRRPATGVEMKSLETAGTRIRRAWLFPMGAAPLVLAFLLVVTIAGRSADIFSGETFSQVDAQPVARVTFDLPTDYNRSVDVDTVPHNIIATNPSGTLVVTLRRIEVNAPALQLLNDHIADNQSIFQDNGFPTSAQQSDVTEVTIGGVKALRYKFDYKHANDSAEQVMYAFVHNGVGYTLDFEALGSEVIATYPAIEKRLLDSFSFAGNNETPAPAATPNTSSTSSASSSSSSSTSSSASTTTTST